MFHAGISVIETGPEQWFSSMSRGAERLFAGGGSFGEAGAGETIFQAVQDFLCNLSGHLGYFCMTNPDARRCANARRNADVPVRPWHADVPVRQ